MGYTDSSAFTKRGARWLIVAAVVVLGIAIRVTVFKSFDSATWKQPGPGDQRRGMYLDITLFHRLAGLKREQVIDLLGPPAKDHGLQGYDLVYPMGTAPLSISRAWLALKFDKEDRVATVEWRTR